MRALFFVRSGRENDKRKNLWVTARFPLGIVRSVCYDEGNNDGMGSLGNMWFRAEQFRHQFLV